MTEQVELDTLRGELREEKEVTAALEEERTDNGRVHNEMRLRLEAERDQARKQVLDEVAEELELRASTWAGDDRPERQFGRQTYLQAVAFCREQANRCLS